MPEGRAYTDALLAELVAIPSGPADGPAAILRRVAEEVEAVGLAPEVDPQHGTLLAVHGEGGVLYNGHLDTVPLGSGWTRDPGERDGHLLYGRGTVDMKGGCVAALAAARPLVAEGVPVGLLFTTDEETSMAGAQALASHPEVRGAAAVVVGEPTGLQVVTGEKGVLWVEATLRGRAAHGSLPHRGRNAILAAGRLLDALRPLAHPRRVHEELTVSVGRIEGGVQTNVVADRCVLQLDLRYPPDLSQTACLRVLRRRAREAGVRVGWRVRHHVPAAATDPQGDHVQRLRELSGGRLRRVTYGTEMAWYARTNPRCVVFGPGDPTRLHVPDEAVDLRQVARCAAIYAEYGRRLAP